MVEGKGEGRGSKGFSGRKELPAYIYYTVLNTCILSPSPYGICMYYNFAFLVC